MKIVVNYLIALCFITSCCLSESGEEARHIEAEHEHTENEVHLSKHQFEALGMKVDSIARRSMRDFIETNGQLTLPPQSKATVTAIIGTNIHSVEVIEGYKVKNGQPLAYLYHPDLIQLQTDFIAQSNQLEYLELEYKRQEKLYQESVASGKEYQKIRADFNARRAAVDGLKSKLKMLHLNVEEILAGKIYEIVPLKAPITGYVQHIHVNTGQFVAPQDKLFEIVQTDHIHAHFKVFESDLQQIREGQTVQFMIESQPEIEHQAQVFAVGKMFEPGIKAVMVHAELENQSGNLLPGMYARGRIVLNEKRSLVMPKDGLVMEADRYYIFQAERKLENGAEEWHFSPMEVSIGLKNDDWVEIKPHQEISPATIFAWNNAYYLQAEMKKEEAGHDH
jgi:cobalt-zinc-cadmium efflux system membrane fusion protein